MRSAGVSINIELERWSIPGSRFLETFKEALPPASVIVLTLHSHNEELRKKNGLYRFGNAQLLDCLEEINSRGLPCVLFFTCGLPFERRSDLEGMARYQRELKRRFPSLRIKTCMIEIEPGCAIAREAQRFGVSLQRSSFSDYLTYHGRRKSNQYLALGYRRPGLPDTRELRLFFCRNFCNRFNAGVLSSTLCGAVSLLRRLGAVKLLDMALRILP
jgi:hypothetical protein